MDSMVVKGTCSNRSYLKQLRVHHACHQPSFFFLGTDIGWMVLFVAIRRCSLKLSLPSNCTPRYLMLLLHVTSYSPSTICKYLKDLQSVTVVKGSVHVIINYPATCYTCKKPGYLARKCPNKSARSVEKIS